MIGQEFPAQLHVKLHTRAFLLLFVGIVKLFLHHQSHLTLLFAVAVPSMSPPGVVKNPPKYRHLSLHCFYHYSATSWSQSRLFCDHFLLSYLSLPPQIGRWQNSDHFPPLLNCPHLFPTPKITGLGQLVALAMNILGRWWIISNYSRWRDLNDAILANLIITEQLRINFISVRKLHCDFFTANHPRARLGSN